ncbi:MAG TPA: hypothetical protein VHB21_05015 [Minicystis sp.]|nr:hypothetical protein [Minicystis sp.]
MHHSLVFAFAAAGSTLVSGCCFHHMEAQKQAFLAEVADRCAAAAPPPQVILVPAGATAVVAPAPRAAPAPPPVVEP